MVKSMSCCFNLIACDGDSSEGDDLQRTETKASTDKHGWSFRKRSTRHRVLSNTVILEVQSAGNKGSPETASTDLQALINPSIPETISVSQWGGKTIPSLLSATKNSKVDDTLIVTGGAGNGDYDLQEAVAIVIQSAIRICLAKNAFYKLKHITKLQALVRGYLVRRQAAGSLRCVQAIVKMQALVRARRARLSLEGLSIQKKHDEKLKTDHQGANPLNYSSDEANKTNVSIEKLLTSRFACQLLESKAIMKPIHINCNSARPESAWKWLERWTAVLSLKTTHPQEPQLNIENLENGAEVNTTVSEIASEVSAEVVYKSPDMKSGETESIDGEQNSDAYIADDFEFQAWKPITISGKISSPAMSDDLEDGHWGISRPETKISTNSDEPELSTENSKHTVERLTSEQLATEGKKFMFEVRKSTNPAFAAVWSKFEELSSTATSGKSMTSVFHDASAESSLDSPQPLTSSITRAKDLSEEFISHDPRIQMWGSECGTELSISSTLDSPDIPEAEDEEIVHEIQFADTENPNKLNSGSADAEVINSSSMLENVHNSSYPGHDQPGKLQEVDGNSAHSVSSMCPGPMNVENPSDQSASDVHSQVDTETIHTVEILFSEGSPGSETTVPDFYGIQSSQISQNSKTNESDNSFSSQKQMPQSVGKRSMSSQTHDLAVRNSREHVPRDFKSGKKRNSFNHEPRAGNSNSLPSYMQATESARAKASVNKSPKLNLDTTGNQSSPQMQQSVPQEHKKRIGNAAYSLQTAIERKWQR